MTINPKKYDLDPAEAVLPGRVRRLRRNTTDWKRKIIPLFLSSSHCRLVSRKEAEMGAEGKKARQEVSGFLEIRRLFHAIALSLARSVKTAIKREENRLSTFCRCAVRPTNFIERASLSLSAAASSLF